MAPHPERLAFEPVDDCLAGGRSRPRLSPNRVAELLGPIRVEQSRPPRPVSEHMVRRWRERGVSFLEADRIAVALGVLPWELWPIEWAMLADDACRVGV
jgi:hypothetical protein